MKRWAIRLAVGLLAIYVVFLGVMYAAMTKSPMEFSRFMMVLPMPLMYATPFPPMWARARAGTLQPGDAAPDFNLERQDHQGRVRLSELRGVRPVVLVFGSYT